jgi:hypothetical protein
MTMSRISVAAVLLTAVVGCSKVTGLIPSKPDFRPELFEPVYRVATELRAAQEVGMNRPRFGELLEKFATELTLARDKAEFPKEQRVIQGYAEVLQIYKDAASIWDVKISVPELKEHAKRWFATIGKMTGSNELIIQKSHFETAVIDGIPLNFYPEGSTGIDGIVARYQLPVKDSKGWKTIPQDSVERIMSKAREKTEQIVKMQKG